MTNDKNEPSLTESIQKFRRLCEDSNTIGSEVIDSYRVLTTYHKLTDAEVAEKSGVGLNRVQDIHRVEEQRRRK